MKTTVTIDWTFVIAVYGAVMATITILWDVWKWRHTGPSVHVTAQANMRTFNIPEFEGHSVMLLNATNRGDRPTTITHFTLHQYLSWLAWIRKKASVNAIVNIPNHMRPPPHVLAPGATVSWPTIQDAEAVAWAKAGRLYLSVAMSHTAKPVYVRVYPTATD